MNYAEKSFSLINATDFRLKSLFWASQFSHTSYFTDNFINFPYGGFLQVLFAGLHKEVPTSKGRSFESIFDFQSKHNTWLTGYFSYDLKNEIEDLESNNADRLGFHDCYFYEPEYIVFFSPSEVRIASKSLSPEEVFNDINNCKVHDPEIIAVRMEARTSKAQYIKKVKRLKEHILNGDIYEINFCIEYFAQATVKPLDVYLKLIEKSPAPFSVFQKINDQFLLSTSPERFLKKTGNKLISQPIKGTASRFRDPQKDMESKINLGKSEKERAENLMIVDLVRNDLAKSALTGSVEVEELFGLYSFSQVHQMISTIVCQKSSGVNFIETIRNAFPMGSMTGAPKIKAMQLIEQYEDSRRSLYSGSVGFISPDCDFDFNVVIRSLLYNSSNNYLSLQVGSAITHDSIAEMEYEECFLKGRALIEVLSSGII